MARPGRVAVLDLRLAVRSAAAPARIAPMRPVPGRAQAKRKSMTLSFGTALIVSWLAMLSGPLAHAQDVYPSKPITLIVPFPPGGVADIVGRPFADALSRELKTPVIIENKAGAGGGIGMGLVAKAKPDGYTLLLALSSISILPEADKVIGRTPLYQLDQFPPIARLSE